MAGRFMEVFLFTFLFLYILTSTGLLSPDGRSISIVAADSPGAPKYKSRKTSPRVPVKVPARSPKNRAPSRGVTSRSRKKSSRSRKVEKKDKYSKDSIPSIDIQQDIYAKYKRNTSVGGSIDPKLDGDSTGGYKKAAMKSKAAGLRNVDEVKRHESMGRRKENYDSKTRDSMEKDNSFETATVKKRKHEGIPSYINGKIKDWLYISKGKKNFRTVFICRTALLMLGLYLIYKLYKGRLKILKLLGLGPKNEDFIGR